MLGKHVRLGVRTHDKSSCAHFQDALLVHHVIELAMKNESALRHHLQSVGLAGRLVLHQLDLAESAHPQVPHMLEIQQRELARKTGSYVTPPNLLIDQSLSRVWGGGVGGDTVYTYGQVGVGGATPPGVVQAETQI